MKLLSPLYIEPNPLLRTFFESSYFTRVYDGGGYELPGDAYRPARKLRLFTFDGMDGVGKSI